MWQGEYRRALKALFGEAEEPHANSVMENVKGNKAWRKLRRNKEIYFIPDLERTVKLNSGLIDSGIFHEYNKTN